MQRSKQSTLTCGLSALVLLLAIRISSAADATVGNGLPSSCTDAALNAAINTVQSDIQGGTVSFNCGVLIGGRTISVAAQKILTGVITIDGCIY